AEVASVYATANRDEVQQAQIALHRSRDAAVRQFAQRMITDHTELNRALANIGMADGRQPNEITQQLRSNSQRTMQVLQQLEGTAFDRTYMQSQVAQHQWLLNTL